MEQPLLGLGLLGFEDAVSRRLSDWVSQTPEGWPCWRVCDPHQADAWMIAGESVEALGRDEVVIRHPYGSGERLTLHRAEVDRPLAFASPLPEGIVSAEHFESDSESSVRQRLQRFEAWLRPLRSQFALGSIMQDRTGNFASGDIVHVSLEGRLLAVIDRPNWQAGLLIPARPVDIAMAEWIHSPKLSRHLPPAFIRLSLYQVMWTYAVRSRRDLLPARYREQRIYLRRVPPLRPGWFDELHLTLMRELMIRPSTWPELVSRVDAPEEVILHHLGALYQGGALTTDAESARRAEAQMRKTMVALHFDQAAGDAAAGVSRYEHSDLMAPSSLLRSAHHSPLRVSTVRPGQEKPPST